ncbi:MAG TPA: glycosyltransferase family 2 protein [Ktedonobacteraceae bacterium]|nr:glycosyltransferase family 2 protein [Ktedonobacteraceae bacterium]
MSNEVIHSTIQHSQEPSQEIQQESFEAIIPSVNLTHLMRQKSVNNISSRPRQEISATIPYQKSFDTQQPPLTLRSFAPRIRLLQIPATPKFGTPIKPLSRIPVMPIFDLPTTPLPEVHQSQFKQRQLALALAAPVTPLPRIPVTPILDLPTIPLPIIGKRSSYQVEQLSVMSLKQKIQYLVFAFMWVAANIYFWHWWFEAGHVGNLLFYVLMSAALLYNATILPSFYTFYLGQMRKPRAVHVENVESAGVVSRVAVISLTVPGSESLEFVKRQMMAMRKIHYPHDSWILVDKEHSPEIQALAQSLGVLYFSRHDSAHWGKRRVALWNQETPPFKDKTKAGNVNSWIDAFGSFYSHFTQLDIDHLPVPSYLNKVLGFFLDPKVKWVQAPSVYGNLENWTARGSAEQEFVLQGPLQMGFFGFCRTPFIIGSHCTYDMKAIKEIGGFQPTRAEDHLDTVFLAAQGYQGVFLPEVIAVGDGPENFETYIGQQFAWAFSMIQVLFTYTPRIIKRYTPRQALQFLFVQTWYTLWSTSMLLLFMLPIIALFTNSSIAHVNYGQFLLHFSLLTVIAFMIWVWSHIWHLPKDVNLSWRGITLHVARWPIVLSALVQVILKVKKPYMITVKGLQHGAKRPFSLAAHTPYFLLMSIALIACWFYLVVFGRSAAQGNLLFALQGALIFLVAYIVSLLKDLTDIVKEGISFSQYIVLRIKPLCVLLMFLTLNAWTDYMCFGHIYQAIISK